MVDHIEVPVLDDAVEDDAEVAFELLDDDTEYFAEDSGVEDGSQAMPKPAPSWRLIEMVREHHDLRMALADFDDYDEFYSFGDFVASDYSH